MDYDTLKAIADISKKVQRVEEKLDSYFSALHKDNSEAIDSILVSLLTKESENV